VSVTIIAGKAGVIEELVSRRDRLQREYEHTATARYARTLEVRMDTLNELIGWFSLEGVRIGPEEHS
jgi:hypothetical protein